MFEKTLLDVQKHRRAKPMAAAVFIETLVIALLIFAPLFFKTENLNGPILIGEVFLPPKSPPGPPADKPKPNESENKPASPEKPKPKPQDDTPQDTLQQPTEIPKDVAEEGGGEKEENPKEGKGNLKGVPGGKPCNTPECVPGGTGEPEKEKEEEKPPPPKPPRVGGDFKQAKLIHRVEPIYPPLAKKNGVQGDVVLDGIIGTDGKVHNIKVVSGHTLLRQSAVDAVEQWKYEPATLNGKLVEVSTTITVKFILK